MSIQDGVFTDAQNAQEIASASQASQSAMPPYRPPSPYLKTYRTPEIAALMAWKPKPRLIHMGRDNDQSYDDVALTMKDDVALNIIKMHIRVLHPLTQEDVRSALADRSPSDQATLVYELIMALERRRLTQMLLN